MGIKVLIIEDDLIIAENLKENLLEMGYSIVGIASRTEEAISLFTEHSPDICLVDIYLKGSSKNGIEIMEFLNAGESIPIIYLTSFADSEYRDRAKSTNAAAYLIKPASKKQIDVAIDFALSNFHKPKLETNNNEDVHCPFFAGIGYFFVKSNGRYEKIYEKNIAYLKASGTYCVIATTSKEYIISANLKSFLSQIQTKDLVRCHRSYAVNINHIQAFDDISLFVLRGNEVNDIPISNSYKNDVFAILPRIKSD